MNTNPSAKRILCYGDSNTWGAQVDSLDKFPVNVRWTGVLQNLLGQDYEIIEEGLRARTTNIDDPTSPNKNGLTYFRPCVQTHRSVDLCILWLGTNDLKKRFNRSAKDIAEALRELIQTITGSSMKETKILLVSSPVVLETSTAIEWDFVGAHEKSLSLGKEIEKIAQEEKVFFVDLAREGITPDPEEGVHLSAEIHTKVAEIFNQKIKEIFS